MRPLRSSPAAYDLHLHTCWSYDASTGPELYFRRARELGVRCIAITEHHNVDSFEEVHALAEEYPGVRAIRAAELSVNTSIGAVDLLCYDLPRRPPPLLAKVLDEYHEWQREAGGARSRSLQALGFDYTEARRLEVLQRYRPARVLARQGATHTLGAFEKEYFIEHGYITREEEYWPLLHRASEMRPPYPPVERVVQAVKEAGGLVVIAHPAGYFNDNDVSRMDSLRRECRLDGIECAHRQIHPELTPFYRAYCRKHKLLSTAGSDCHGLDDVLTTPEKWGYTNRRRFACHLGEEAWLEEFLERIPVDREPLSHQPALNASAS